MEILQKCPTFLLKEKDIPPPPPPLKKYYVNVENEQN
jgi:hypothetical protein